MKIIILGPAHPLRGGIANTNESLCKALNETGANCSIISFKLQYPKLLFPGKTQYTEDPPPAGLSISSLINSINPLNWIKVASAIKKEAPDLVVVRFWIPFLGPCLGTICKRINKSTTVISIVDNLIPHEKRMGDKSLTKYFANACHGFVAMSSSVKTDILNMTGKEAKYLPHPLNDNMGDKLDRALSCEKLGLNPDHKYVFFFGLVRKYKGLDLLLEAMTKEQVRKQNIQLLIVGEFYDDPAPYLDFIKTNDLTDNVIVRNEFIPSDQVKYYFSAADLLTQTYHTATQSGITQIAYHFDLPMLVTDVGGLAEIVPHGKVGYVVKKNPEAIALAITDFFEHNKKAEFSLNVSIEKKKFQWDTFANNMLDFYRKTKQ